MLCLWPYGLDITVTDAIRYLALEQGWIFLVPLAADVEALVTSHVVNRKVERRVLASHLRNSLKSLLYQLVDLVAFKSFRHKGSREKTVD